MVTCSRGCAEALTKTPLSQAITAMTEAPKLLINIVLSYCAEIVRMGSVCAGTEVGLTERRPNHDSIDNSSVGKAYCCRERKVMRVAFN